MSLTAQEVSDRHNAKVAEKTPAKGHNSQGQLQSYVERFTSLAEQAAELREDTKELAAEAKSAGFDAAAIKKIVKVKMETAAQRSKREDSEMVLDTYRNALGMLD